MKIISAFYDKLQKVVMALPGVHEKLCYGTRSFYVEKKLLARLKEDGETVAVYNKDRDEWIAKDGDTFFITDHYRNSPMMLVDLNLVSNDDLKILAKEAWEMRASKKIRQQYNSTL